MSALGLRDSKDSSQREREMSGLHFVLEIISVDPSKGRVRDRETEMFGVQWVLKIISMDSKDTHPHTPTPAWPPPASLSPAGRPGGGRGRPVESAQAPPSLPRDSPLLSPACSEFCEWCCRRIGSLLAASVGIVCVFVCVFVCVCVFVLSLIHI